MSRMCRLNMATPQSQAWRCSSGTAAGLAGPHRRDGPFVPNFHQRRHILACRETPATRCTKRGPRSHSPAQKWEWPCPHGRTCRRKTPSIDDLWHGNTWLIGEHPHKLCTLIRRWRSGEAPPTKQRHLKAYGVPTRWCCCASLATITCRSVPTCRLRLAHHEDPLDV